MKLADVQNRIRTIKNILIPKETRADETRVAMIPADIKLLTDMGYMVFIEHNAGKATAYSDQDYIKAGAHIRTPYETNELVIDYYKELFKNIDMIVRVKRPDRSREELENQAIPGFTIMVGALDLNEPNSPHINEYHQNNIIAYSLDQLDVSKSSPINILATMSKMAGQLALHDGLSKCKIAVKKVTVIGFGVAGRAIYEEALALGLSITVIMLTPKIQADIRQLTEEQNKLLAKFVVLPRDISLQNLQNVIQNIVIDSDIVITTARSNREKAPILIKHETLSKMKNGSVVVDLSLSEGGNVEGSHHDQTLTLENGVIITNTSGYPKARPIEASKLWSQANYYFLAALKDNIQKNSTELISQYITYKLQIPVYYVDAFTAIPYLGNPAAVCILQEWLADDSLQLIARINNLPATAFIIRQNKDTFLIRWFAPDYEIKLCGHGTISAACVIFNEFLTDSPRINFVSQEFGTLIATKKNEFIELVFPVKEVTEVTDSIIKDQLRKALGFNFEKVFKHKNERFMVVFEDESIITQIQPETSILKTLVSSSGAIVVTAASKIKNIDFVSRTFYPHKTIIEDFVTGASHCMLAPLWAAEFKKNQLHARQISARPGDILCTVLPDRVLLSGKAIINKKSYIYV